MLSCLQHNRFVAISHYPVLSEEPNLNNEFDLKLYEEKESVTISCPLLQQQQDKIPSPPPHLPLLLAFFIFLLNKA